MQAGWRCGVSHARGDSSVRRLSMESVAIILHCAECRAQWLPAHQERWRAYLGSDGLDELPEVVFDCPRCVGRDFGDAKIPLGTLTCAEPTRARSNGRRRPSSAV
jgi:hypothetical protein